MKRIYIDAPTLLGGVWYEPSHLPQFAPDHIADYLVEIGNAHYFETKVVEVMESKAEKKSSSALPPDPASPPKIANTPRRGRRSSQ